MKALPEGQYIKHFQYGLGVITESDNDRTSIDFDLHGMKKFVTSIMVVEIAEGTPPKRKRAKRVKKVAARGRGCRRKMSNNKTSSCSLSVLKPKPQGREYTFTVRETATEPREFTLTIPNEAFNTRRVRFQDAPDICSHRLHLELAATENHPVKTHFNLTDAELEAYRTSHMQKPPKYPYAPKKDDQEA